MPTRSRSGNVRSVVTRANGLHVGFAVLLRVVDLGTLLQKPARRVLCWRTADLGVVFYTLGVERDESFVDDLNKERGSVSTRVGFVLRSAEDLPLFQ